MIEMPAGYDAWKTDPGYGEPDEECYHEHYEIDILTGRAHCDACGERFWPSADEILAFRELEAFYDAYCRREERSAWWREFWQRWFWRPTLPARMAVNVMLVKLGFHHKVNVIRVDDEIPF